MEYEVAVGIIDSCGGFTDLETPVGEAWISVQEEFAAIRARLAEVEAQRDGLKEAMIRICDTSDNERGNAWELCDIASAALAKLEEQ